MSGERLGCPSLVATGVSAQVPLSTAVTKSPDLNLILQRMEDVEHRDAAQSRTYDVTREYKMFHGAETQPASEVTAQVDFVPPDAVRYKITQTRGSSRPLSRVRMRRALMSDEVRMKKDE